MYPYPFDYLRPATLAQAEALFDAREDAAYLSGGHTLIPTMKNRLAMPQALIDLRGIPDLHGITRAGDRLEIGAATTHRLTATSAEVSGAIPALAALAGTIADPAVRNFGTMGGSLANNDPAADYPAAVLGLGAAVVTNRRRIAADDFFMGLFTTALDPGEIIVRLSFPIPAAAGYAKLCSQASRYAMAGAFVARTAAGVRVAVTGAGSDGVFRWSAAEDALAARFAADAIGALLPDAGAMISDMHGDGDYRATLVAAMTRRAVENMGGAHVR